MVGTSMVWPPHACIENKKKDKYSRSCLCLHFYTAAPTILMNYIPHRAENSSVYS